MFFVFCIQIDGIFCEKLKKDIIYPLGGRDGRAYGPPLRRCHRTCNPMVTEMESSDNPVSVIFCYIPDPDVVGATRRGAHPGLEFIRNDTLPPHCLRFPCAGRHRL